MQRLDLGGGISLITLVALAKDTSMKIAMHYLNLPQKTILCLLTLYFPINCATEPPGQHQNDITHQQRTTKEIPNFSSAPTTFPDESLSVTKLTIIATKIKHRKFVTNARSYGGIKSYTDHKLVKMSMNFQWHKLQKQKQRTNMTNITNFSDREKQTLYNQEIQNTFQPSVATSPQEQWTYIADVCKDTGKEILGHKDRKQKINDPELKELSQKSHKLHLDISASKDKNKRANLRAERKQIIKLIRKKISNYQSQVIEDKLQQLETFKDDSNRYYQVLRSINNNKRKQPLCVQDEDGNIVSSEKDQADIISHHFCQLLAPDDVSRHKSYAPCAMFTPFTGDEIYEAAKSMKNGKSSGIDDIHAEHIKYAPPSVHENIAHILNTTAKDGNPPDELKIGILTPLPKPGKKKSPPENLRPIILLSVLRKLLTICLMRRTWDRLKTRIPLDQAAYQEGRSTTEQVFFHETTCRESYHI